jgi:hypothetical protein
MKANQYFIFILSIISLTLKSQVNSGFGYFEPDLNIACLTPEQYKIIEKEIQISLEDLHERGLLPQVTDNAFTTMLAWPLEQNNGLNDYGYHCIASLVDHDPGYPDMLLDYNCGTRTYDRADGTNHNGTDMRLWPFWWYKMDHDQVKVLAAAPGIIVFKRDGQFDRSCSPNSNLWNGVSIRHSDGSVAWYGHFKNGSLTNKIVGETVETSEYLGMVGSSGNSQRPHLHFEIHDESSSVIDPYFGNCNNFNSQSWWIDQRPYYDSGLNALLTHSAPPVFPPCPETEILNEKNQFCSGEEVYFAGYFRDQLDNQQVGYTIFYPDDSIFQQWSQTFNDTLIASYYYWSYALPVVAPTGKWKFQINYEGETYEKFFDVIGATTLAVSENSSFCEGDSIILEAPESHYGFTYQWRKNGVDIPGATFSTYLATEAGEYSFNVSFPNGCSADSDTLLVELSLPPTVDLGDDIVNVKEDEVILNAGGVDLSYLWSTGEETDFITVDSSGVYSVTVTDSNGCTASDEVEVIFIMTSTQRDLTKTISIYPNPAGDYFYIRIENQKPGSIKLMDPLGRVVKEVEVNDLCCELIELYVGDIYPGLYFIQLGSKHDLRIGGVVKN